MYHVNSKLNYLNFYKIWINLRFNSCKNHNFENFEINIDLDMDIFLIILAGICVVVGFIGCIVPVIPGTPISYVGILLLHFTDKVQFSTQFLIFWAVIVVIVQVLDYFVPMWGTKRFGGTKWGTVGSTIGVFVGLFFAPWGIIVGPFLGAVIGELLYGRKSHEALKAGLGSFVGFLFGTVTKLIVAGFLIFYYVHALVTM